LSDIWIQYAIIYIENGDWEGGNKLFAEAVEVNFVTQEDFLNLYITWIELLITNKYLNDAVLVCKKALFHKKGDLEHHKLNQNLKLWKLFIDIELSLGSYENIKSAYKRAIELKIITPLMILNYG